MPLTLYDSLADTAASIEPGVYLLSSTSELVTISRWTVLPHIAGTTGYVIRHARLSENERPTEIWYVQTGTVEREHDTDPEVPKARTSRARNKQVAQTAPTVDEVHGLMALLNRLVRDGGKVFVLR